MSEGKWSPRSVTLGVLLAILAGAVWPLAGTAGEAPLTRFLTLAEAVDHHRVAEAVAAVPAPLRALRALQAEGNQVAESIRRILAARGHPRSLAVWAARGVCVDLTDAELASLLAEYPTLRAETLDQTAEPIRSAAVSGPVATDRSPPPNAWSLAMSGSTALLQERQLTGKNVLVGVIGPDLPINHPCLQGKISFAKYFGDPAHRGGTIEDLMLLHPLGVLAGDSPGKFQGVAHQLSVSLATVSRGKVNAQELLAAIQWVMEPFSDRKPSAILLCLDFNGPAPRPIREVLAACRTAGILPIVPAGNVASRITGMAALPEVLTVGALDQWKNRAGFSGIGPGVVEAVPIPKPDLAEPGVSIFGPSADGGYRYGSGTLQGAAHFAGIWAQMRQARPDDDIQTMLDALATTTQDLGPAGFDMETGLGLVNPVAALYTIENPPPPPTDEYPARLARRE